MNNKIAIVYSPCRKCASDFLYYHGLNPKMFIVASEPMDFCGIIREMPVIFTYFPPEHKYIEKNREVMQLMKTMGFKSVRYIDY